MRRTPRCEETEIARHKANNQIARNEGSTRRRERKGKLGMPAKEKLAWAEASTSAMVPEI